MKRQRANLTRVQRDVMRLRQDEREMSPETKRRVRWEAGEEMDRDIERQLMRSAVRVRLFGERDPDAR